MHSVYRDCVVLLVCAVHEMAYWSLQAPFHSFLPHGFLSLSIIRFPDLLPSIDISPELSDICRHTHTRTQRDWEKRGGRRREKRDGVRWKCFAQLLWSV